MNAESHFTQADRHAVALVGAALVDYTGDIPTKVYLTPFPAKLVGGNQHNVVGVRQDTGLVYIMIEVGPYNQQIEIAPVHFANWCQVAVEILYQMRHSE